MLLQIHGDGWVGLTPGAGFATLGVAANLAGLNLPDAMPVPKWRNWQTRMVQVHVLARVWRFKSSLRHQILGSRFGNAPVNRGFVAFGLGQLQHLANFGARNLY